MLKTREQYLTLARQYLSQFILTNNVEEAALKALADMHQAADSTADNTARLHEHLESQRVQLLEMQRRVSMKEEAYNSAITRLGEAEREIAALKDSNRDMDRLLS